MNSIIKSLLLSALVAMSSLAQAVQVDTVIDSKKFRDARFTAAGGHTPAMLVSTMDGEPDGILKFTHTEERSTLVMGIDPGEGPLRERLASLVCEVIAEHTDVHFGVPKTYFTFMMDPTDVSADPVPHLASYQRYIANSMTLRQAGLDALNNVKRDEFQKFLFHVIMMAVDAHEGNILLTPVEGSNELEVHLIDMGNSLPRSLENGFYSSFNAWLLHPTSINYMSEEWRQSLGEMDVQEIVEEIRNRWDSEVDLLDLDTRLHPEIWDLLTISLSTVKFGAKYNRQMRNIGSIFTPVKMQQNGETVYYGGEIEDLYALYYDEGSERWFIEEALTDLELTMSRQKPSRIKHDTAFINLHHMPTFE